VSENRQQSVVVIQEKTVTIKKLDLEIYL